MPTIQDLLAIVATIPDKNTKLAADTDLSHAAVQKVADTTATQAALVQAAQAAAAVAIGADQSAADAAVATTEADRADFDATIDALVATANALKA